MKKYVYLAINFFLILIVCSSGLHAQRKRKICNYDIEIRGCDELALMLNTTLQEWMRSKPDSGSYRSQVLLINNWKGFERNCIINELGEPDVCKVYNSKNQGKTKVESYILSNEQNEEMLGANVIINFHYNEEEVVCRTSVDL